jgi:hypothetical protein
MTRADIIPAARDEDTRLIAELRRQAAALAADRDELLFALKRVTDALGLSEGLDIDKVVRRIEDLA